jgi:hypothetical protein
MMIGSAPTLIYGTDNVLLETRALVLGKAGIPTVAVSRLAELRDQVSSTNAAMIIFCSSLEDREVVAGLLELAKLGKSNIKKLVLTKEFSDSIQTISHVASNTTVLRAPVGPVTFQSTVGRVLGEASPPLEIELCQKLPWSVDLMRVAP